MPALSKKQQRFFGMVRATQKGEMENPSPEVAKVAATTSRSSVKKFAKTKHKGLPEKKVTKESFNEDYVKELEDGLVKMDYPTYDEVDKLMCKIAKENDIDTTTLHMAFKTKHLMVPDDWAKKKMFEPIMIPKTPKITGDVKEERGRKDLKINPDLKAAIRKKQKEVQDKQVNLDNKKNTPIDSGEFQRNKPVDAATRKRMSAPENQFNSFEPENSLVEKLTAIQRFKRDAGAIAKKKIKQKEHNKYVNFLDVDEAVNPAQQAAIAISKKQRLMDLMVAKKKKKKLKEEQNPEGMKYSDKKKIERQEQLKKASAKAPIVKNKIVPLHKESSYEDFEKKSGVKAVKPKKETELPKTPKKEPANTYASGNPVGKANVKRKLLNVSPGSKREVASRGILGKIKHVITGEEVIYEYDGNYHMNKIAKEKGLDLTDPRQRRRANSLARKNAAKGNVNNPAGFSKRKKRTKMQIEGNLHQWFKGSKSKDGKGGWVNVVTGGTCASDKPGEGTPKCVSSSKRASMTKAERLSAQRRKKKADPNQQSKTGAAKPTYVSTDSPRKKKKVDEAYGGRGSSRIARLKSIHPPTAKAAIKNIPDDTSDRGSGNKAKRRMKEEYINELETKTMLNYIDKASDSASKQLNKAKKFEKKGKLKKAGQARAKMDQRERGIAMAKDKIVKRQEDKTLTSLRRSYEGPDAVRENYKPVIKSVDECWKTHKKVGMKMKGGKLVNDCRPKNESFGIDEDKKPLSAASKRLPGGAPNKKLGLDFDLSGVPDRPKPKEPEKRPYVRMSHAERVKDNKRRQAAKDAADPNKKERQRKYQENLRKNPAVIARKKAIKQGRYPKYGNDISFADISRKNQDMVDSQKKGYHVNTPREVIQDNYEPVISEKCWKGYEKKGMKTMFGKRYPNCVKKKRTRKEEFSPILEGGARVGRKFSIGKIGKQYGRDEYGDPINKDGSSPLKKNVDKNPKDDKTPNTLMGEAMIRVGAASGMKMDAKAKKYKPAKMPAMSGKSDRGVPSKKLPDEGLGDVSFGHFPKSPPDNGDAGSGVRNKKPTPKPTPALAVAEAKSPAWQRKAGKSESGGLNAKGVASYRAANPGSKLKTAVTTKPSKLKKGSKSAKRRLSFCRRMRGMKKKLTSAKTARDPNSRINKSLRKWNCSFEPENGQMIMERGPHTLGSGARQKSIHAKTGQKGTKKVSGMIKSLKRKNSILNQPMGGPADAAAKARRLSYVKDDVDLTILRFIDEGHMNKTCGKGEYYCYQDKKCKSIPKGMKIGYGGMLKPIENEKDESNGKKGGSNGNGNGHGGNGNGHGGNGNGGNGGGNGGGE